MDASLMKLIAYGKVMEDNTKVLKDYSIKDGDFLVVMISKVRLTTLTHFHRLSQLPSPLQNKPQRKLLQLTLLLNLQPVLLVPHRMLTKFLSPQAPQQKPLRMKPRFKI